MALYLYVHIYLYFCNDKSCLSVLFLFSILDCMGTNIENYVYMPLATSVYFKRFIRNVLTNAFSKLKSSRQIHVNENHTFLLLLPRFHLNRINIFKTFWFYTFTHKILMNSLLWKNDCIVNSSTWMLLSICPLVWFVLLHLSK